MLPTAKEARQWINDAPRGGLFVKINFQRRTVTLDLASKAQARQILKGLSPATLVNVERDGRGRVYITAG